MIPINAFRSALSDRDEQMRRELRSASSIEREMPKAWCKPTRGVVSLITGPRRAGKTTYAYWLGSQWKNPAYVNFEDERLNVPSAELNRVLEAVYSLKGEVDLLVLDEIQNVQGWETFVARIAPSTNVVVTGSNARLMSKEMATRLTGRHVDHLLFPFSFREFCQFKAPGTALPQTDSTRDRARARNLLEEYLRTGGFPLSGSMGREYLVQLYQDVIERDVLGRYHIRYARKFREFARHLVSNVATETSYNRLRKAFGLKGFHTVGNWIGYLEAAYLLFELPRFSYRLREQALAPRKVYCVDTGLVQSVGFLNSPNQGHLMENLVAVELLRRISYWNSGTELFYWKDHAQREVDFVLRRGNRVVQLVQVTKTSQPGEIEPRELDALVRASEDLRCEDLLVLTWEGAGEIHHSGHSIRIQPLIEWLLDRTLPQRALNSRRKGKG
ncbi:AAA+ superfamily ATPase [mine drainage metagenome]|uniref:AAA+ superfamily ATPase n=2 Tax=mine drainage metagenome TaxID=410659 RepID=T0Z7D8_9ZZZZ